MNEARESLFRGDLESALGKESLRGKQVAALGCITQKGPRSNEEEGADPADITCARTGIRREGTAANLPSFIP